MPGPISSVRLSNSSRVEAFSDAVFAIVITILVLDLRVPRYEPGHLLAALTGLWASLLAFLLSFLRVGVVWLNHHGLFSHVRGVNRTLLWMNFGVLVTCMIIPFPTAVLAQALRDGNLADLRVAAFLYTLVGWLQVAAWLPLFPYLRDHPEMSEPLTEARYFHAQRPRVWIGVGIETIIVIVALIAPIPALALWTLSLVYIAVTSDGLQQIPFWMRRRSHALKEERGRRATARGAQMRATDNSVPRCPRHDPVQHSADHW